MSFPLPANIWALVQMTTNKQVNDAIIDTDIPALTTTSGTVAIAYDAKKVFRFRQYLLTAATAFTVDTTGLAGIYHLTFRFNGLGYLATFPATWIPEPDSDSIVNNGLTHYFVTIKIGGDGKVFYKVDAIFAVTDADFTGAPIVMIGDHGEDADPGHDTVGNYVNSLAPAHLLLAGDVNYPSGSASTINANVTIFDALIAAQKVWPIFGNHDLDTISFATFTVATAARALAGTWRWSSANNFASNWKTDASVSAAWATVGEAAKVPGFGESDSPTVPVTSDSGASYYFVAIVNLASAPTAGHKARLRMYIDDGAQVFINGVLAYDFNCVHPVSDSSLAHIAASTGTSETTDTGHVWAERRLHEILVDASFFQSGDNIIACHIHQNGTSSTDVSWDCQVDIGTTTDVVPGKTDAVPYTNGYGQPMKNKFPYVPGGCAQYRVELGADVVLYGVNDGQRSDARLTHPGWNLEEGAQAQWLKNQLLAETKKFKIVQCHRPFFSVNEGGSDRHNAVLDWSFLKTTPGLVLFNGHNHQTLIHQHTGGMYIVNASNVGRQDGLAGMDGSSTGITAIYEDDSSSNLAVAVIHANANVMRIQLRKVSDGSIIRQIFVSP